MNWIMLFRDWKLDVTPKPTPTVAIQEKSTVKQQPPLTSIPKPPVGHWPSEDIRAYLHAHLEKKFGRPVSSDERNAFVAAAVMCKSSEEFEADTDEIAANFNAAQPAAPAKAEESHMGFFSSIAGAEHTVAAFLERELTALEGKEPQIERVIDGSLKWAGPALQFALSASGNTVAAGIAGKVIAQAQADLKVGSALVYDFGPVPSAASIFTSVSTNLSGLLTAGHITSQKSIDAVKKVVGDVGALGTAVNTAVKQIALAAKPDAPPPATAATAATAASTAVSHVQPEAPPESKLEPQPANPAVTGPGIGQAATS